MSFKLLYNGSLTINERNSLAGKNWRKYWPKETLSTSNSAYPSIVLLFLPLLLILFLVIWKSRKSKLATLDNSLRFFPRVSYTVPCFFFFPFPFFLSFFFFFSSSAISRSARGERTVHIPSFVKMCTCGKSNHVKQRVCLSVPIPLVWTGLSLLSTKDSVFVPTTALLGELKKPWEPKNHFVKLCIDLIAPPPPPRAAEAEGPPSSVF